MEVAREASGKVERERERERDLVRSAKVRSALSFGVKIMTFSPLLRRGVGGEASEVERSAKVRSERKNPFMDYRTKD
jgi:hypothetical protein